jgi:hypothetical protein
LGEDVLALLTRMAAPRTHVFASIACYSPDDQGSGAVELLYPRSKPLVDGLNEAEARSWFAANCNLSKSEIQPDGSVELFFDLDW